MDSENFIAESSTLAQQKRQLDTYFYHLPKVVRKCLQSLNPSPDRCL